LKLKDIATIKTGLVLNRKKASSYEDTKSYKVISLKAFSNSIFLDTAYSEEFITDKDIDDFFFTKVGDIVVRLRAPIIAVCIDETSKDMIVPSLMCIVRIKDKDMIDPKYLANYLNSNIIQKTLNKNIKGTTIAMIKTADLGNIDVVFPSLKEQQTIVSFLELSQKEISLIENLKRKKELFTQKALDKTIQQIKEKSYAKN